MDCSLSHFSRQFYLDCPAIASNRDSRWCRFLTALNSGRLLERPRVAPTWQPHKEYQAPIFDRLQSSYEDVRAEMDAVRDKFKSERITFLAGDGLSLMRINHILANEPDVYLDQSPAIVPIQGADHGPYRLTCSLEVVCPLRYFCQVSTRMAYSMGCIVSGASSAPSS